MRENKIAKDERQVGSVTKNLDITRKELAIVIGKSIDTINKMSYTKKPLLLDDIVKVYQHKKNKKDQYQSFVQDISNKMLGDDF